MQTGSSDTLIGCMEIWKNHALRSLYGNEWRERGYGLSMKEFASRIRNDYVVIKYLAMILATLPTCSLFADPWTQI
jgi:hypothetical protein